MRAQLLLRLKRRLAKHAMAEEDIVYPLLHGDGERADHVRQLYAEHGEIKILLYSLEHLSSDTREWIEQADRLHALIGAHAEQEEHTEFPLLRARIDEAARSRLYGEVEREKAMIL